MTNQQSYDLAALHIIVSMMLAKQFSAAPIEQIEAFGDDLNSQLLDYPVNGPTEVQHREGIRRSLTDILETARRLHP